MAAWVATLALVISVLLLALPPANCGSRGFRASLIRREKSINFTLAAQQSSQRLSILAARLNAASGGTNTQVPLRAAASAYDMDISIGTPPQKLSAVADTGSDLVWAKCGPCASCTPQGSPSFDPTKSTSFSKLACSDILCQALQSQSLGSCSADGTECDYKYFYGLSSAGDHYTQGYMRRETFTIGGDAVKGVGFGCTNMSHGDFGTGSGLVGLGRGPLSLVSQLGVGAFSYCLISDPSKTSPLLFGSQATLTGAGVQSTPLLDSLTTVYPVNLKGISIGTATTPGVGSSARGLVFDSGTTLTYLAEPAYTAAKTSIVTQTSLRKVANREGYEPCFQAPDDGDISSAVPPMVLHFDGADMNLPMKNYFKEVQTGVVCWIVQPSPSLSIIGNIMQMNYHIRYDVHNMVLSFQPANCDSL